MRATLANLGALFLGLCSSALVIALLVGFERLTDFNLFSLSIWLVVPVGAFVTGLLAAGGYYLGAVKLHAKPTALVALGMAAIAALTQVGLYFARYQLATMEDGSAVSDVIDFPVFVSLVLTQARYGLHAHGASLGSGVTVGAMGYVIAATQFLALLAGGLGVYAILADRPYCDPCAKYPRSIETREVALDGAALEPWLGTLRTHPLLSPQYLAQLAPVAVPGTAAVELERFACASCGRHAVVEHPKLMVDGKWVYQSEANRTAWTSTPASDTPSLAALG